MAKPEIKVKLDTRELDQFVRVQCEHDGCKFYWDGSCMLKVIRIDGFAVCESCEDKEE